MKEQDALILETKVNRSNLDVIIQNEVCLLLSRNVELLGFYVLLAWLSSIGGLRQRTQKHVAKIMGLTFPIYAAKLRQLEKLNLITVKNDKGTFYRKTYTFTLVSRLPLFALPSNRDEVEKYLAEAQKQIKIGEIDEGLLLFPRFKENGKKEIKRYPREWYHQVVTAYKKYKGVKLVGPDEQMAFKAAKQMFEAEHKPEDIIKFMKWLHDNEDSEENSWARLWTIWTVRKKMPEFMAGKLKSDKEIMEDKYEEF